MQSARTFRRIIVTGCLCALAVCFPDCGVPYESTLEDPAVLKPAEAQMERGLVWMFPGLVGAPWELGPAYRGLRDAGLKQAVRFYQWDIPAPNFTAHLERYSDNVAQAQVVADDIVAYRRAHRDATIDLVGYSAGGFFALMVAGALPPDVRLRNIVLAQPDVSPTFDLTPALEHVDGQLVNFYSPDEWMLSGLFTMVMGTMDRQYVASAGKSGFNLAEAVPDPALRDKVVPVRWSAAMNAVGISANHLVILDYAWNKDFVAPYVVDPEDLVVTGPPGAADAATSN